MWRSDQAYDEVFQQVKASRGVANPNIGFICQVTLIPQPPFPAPQVLAVSSKQPSYAWALPQTESLGIKEYWRFDCMVESVFCKP